ncbi:MAG: DGQHR domain-containing protein [Rhizobiaceae bacterium]|nr:DGQHR domain-containing protein [Rhizobiaceae bacterium]
MPKFKYIKISQSSNTFMLTAIPARLLTKIAYASIRRQDDEQGAVQRVLNTSRISGIKEFALQRGDFPASIVLNWVGKDLVMDRDNLTIPDVERSAQIIDGQHRVAGLRAAIAEKPALGSTPIPVAIYSKLDTPQSARIFLSINTEQRPVPKSLVFDLYGVTGADLMDPSAIRAGDIVTFLNEDSQPYDGLIKFPNTARQRGGIALSTAVTAVKPLVEPKGILDQIGASELETQKAIFNNYFSVLEKKYEGLWQERSNAFIYASGFIGAIEFLRTKLIDYCAMKKSFERRTISDVIKMDASNRILQEEVKGLGGTDAANHVRDRLIQAFRPTESTQQLKV